jgi:hypothetical protein
MQSYLLHESFHAQNNEPSGSIIFLQPYPIVAADALLKIVMAVISAVLSLYEHLSQTNTYVSHSFIRSQCIVVIFDTFLSGCILLNASQAAENYFHKK